MKRNWVGTAIVIGALAGCSATVPPPPISAVFTGAGYPQPRPDSAPVDIFPKGSPPMNKYEILGSVEVSNDDLNRSKKDLMRYARSEVRKMGGDALINVEFRVGTVGALGKAPRSSATRWESERSYDHNEGFPTDGRGNAVIAVKGRVVRWSDPQP